MKKTAAKTLLEDSRYKEGKQKILEAMRDAKQKLQGCHHQDSSTYSSLIDSMGALRGNHLYYPYLGSGLGNGLIVELADGSTKYDLISGIGTHYFGHNFEELTEALIDSAVQDVVMQGNLEQNEDSHTLLQQLIHASHMDHAMLATSGAMANENGFKIIFQKQFPRKRLLAFTGCFMGRSLLLANITDKPAFRVGLPSVISVDYLPFYDSLDHEGSIARAKKALLTHLHRYPQEHAALCIEPVQGENGFYVGNKQFFQELATICKEHDIAIFVDEVQTFARTPSLFAFHYYEMQAYTDVVTIGKVSQVAATLWTKAMNPKPGLLSQTFTASTSAIRAALFTLEYAATHNFFGDDGKINALHYSFKKALEKINKRHPGMCEGPYGIGSMIAFTTAGGDAKKTAAFVHKLYDNGVIAFVAGSHPVRVRFLVPPALIRDSDIEKIAAIIEHTIEQCREE